MILDKVMVLSLILTEVFILDNLKMELPMAKVNIIGPMVRLMKVNGIKAENMEKDFGKDYKEIHM